MNAYKEVRVGPPGGPCRGPLPRGACSRLAVTRTREKEKIEHTVAKEERLLLAIELPTCRQGEEVLAIITMQSSTRVMRRRRRKGSFQIVFRSTRRKGTKERSTEEQKRFARGNGR